MTLTGKTVWYFGDSIMAQDGKSYAYQAEQNKRELGKICRGYPTILRETFSIGADRNFAVGGQGVSAQRKIIEAQDFAGVDAVVIAMGVNDFSAGLPVGALPDSRDEVHDATFIGEYCAALDHIFKSNPRIKVVLMTPLHRNTLMRTSPGPQNTIDTRINGHTLKDYADAVKMIGAFYACPVADLYAESGLNRFNLHLYTFEGVHPTDEGYERIAPVLIEAMKKL